MMKIVLTILGGILIGPLAGYYGIFWLYEVQTHHHVLARLEELQQALASLFLGVPLGAVTFAVIGFLVGYMLDKRAKRRRSDKVSSQLGA